MNQVSKKHWEDFYLSHSQDSLSWYQEKPELSLRLIEENTLTPDSAIIDIGGGDSLLVDYLILKKYQQITVLDISEAAIDRAKSRLGILCFSVNWIIADITSAILRKKYDLWHDRAAFHFLTTDQAVNDYVRLASDHINKGGKLILGTFAEDGPKKCSGLTTNNYSSEKLEKVFAPYFIMEKSIKTIHITPKNTEQSFIFAVFTRK